MAWEAVSKANVSEIAGIASASLNDLWYDAAIDIIAEKARRYNIANPTAVTDVLDGSGTARMWVRRPPISAITSVTVDDVLVASSKYTSDGAYVVLIDDFGTNPYLIGDIFPKGTKNVSISYTSGATTDNAASMAIALIVKEFANITTSEGAESRLQFSGVDRSSAQAFRYGRSGPGMASRIEKIIDKLLGIKMRAR